MTKQLTKKQLHITVVGLVFGMALVITLVSYLSANVSSSSMAFGDGFNSHIVAIHPQSNGLAGVSLVHDQSQLGNAVSLGIDSVSKIQNK